MRSGLQKSEGSRSVSGTHPTRVGWVRSLVLRALASTCPHTKVGAFDLVDLAATGCLSLLVQRVGAALDLIKTYDYRRFIRVERNLRRIALISAGGEFYHHGLRAYVVDLDNLKRRPIPEFAATIVHEATHARLERAGIHTTRSNQGRIEGICTEEAAAFAERLPGEQGLAERLRRTLENPWWMPEELRRRRHEQITSSGMPRWLQSFFRRLAGK